VIAGRGQLHTVSWLFRRRIKIVEKGGPGFSRGPIKMSSGKYMETAGKGSLEGDKGGKEGGK